MSRAAPRRIPSLASVGLFASGLLATTHAAAEPGRALESDVAPPGDAGLMTSGADARGALILRARAIVELVARPLVLVDGEQREEAVVDEQLWLRVGLSLALWHRLLVYADVPYATRSEGGGVAGMQPIAPHPSEAQALGDIKTGLRVRVLGPSGNGTQVAAGAELWLPTGSEAAYTGDGSFRGRLYAALGASHRRTQWAVQTGFTLRASERLGGILPTRTGSSILMGASLRTAIDAGGHVSLGPEMLATLVTADGSSLFDPRSTAVQLLLAGRYRPPGLALDVGAAVGPGLGRGVGAADYRALAFIGWSPEEPAPPPDCDGDGVADAHDICINLPGEVSEDPLMNGCPAVPLDSDGDGIPDAFDACPREAGIPTRAARTHGCPKLADGDADTIPDLRDACPDEKGVSSADPAKNGCPPPPAPAANLVAEKIVISEQVQFETGTALIRAESDGILAQVARVLAEHPDLELVEIEGHTDDTGTPEVNRRLSQERADAVRTWLVAHGVVPKRLVAKGYGQSRPIDDNATESGRARNRRVEFRVVRGPGAQEKQR